MRILLLCPEIPELAGTGGARREWEIVKGLQRRGHELVVGSVARRDQADAVEALQARGVETIVAVRPEPQWKEALLGGLRAPRTVGVLAKESFHRYQAAIFAEEMRAPLAAWFAAHTVDVALIQHDWAMSEFGALIPPSVPTIGGFHHIALMHQRAAETAEGRARQLFEKREARLQAADMRRLPQSMVAGSACSAVEAASFTEFSGLPCSVVPNGADVEALSTVPTGGGTPGALLFSGSLGYPPNSDAGIWLASEVLPRVQRAVPEAKLTIVGKNAPESLQALAAEDVHLTGFVPELEPVLEATQVYVAGLLSGAGTKLKVVEALAAGRPLVATSVAAEGIEIEHEVHALIADGADAFAAAVVRLLQDRELAERLATAGRAYVTDHLSWDAAVEVLHQQLGELLPAAV
jgi:glycosyltransferase involved in cell wall biosynthesis